MSSVSFASFLWDVKFFSVVFEVDFGDLVVGLVLRLDDSARVDIRLFRLKSMPLNDGLTRF